MKRTSFINLAQWKKCQSVPVAKPLVIAMAAALAACGQKKEQVTYVTSVDDCSNSTSLSVAQCEVAYKKALAEAARTGPKYQRRYECETEFGDNQCVKHNSGFFMPLMTGFLVSSAIHQATSAYNPVYYYSSPFSNYRNRLILSDGTVVGRRGSKSYSLPSGAASKKMPTVTKTVSRGGFGSVASAKSSWGSTRSGGWGG